jgi:hypothetical protein
MSTLYQNQPAKLIPWLLKSTANSDLAALTLFGALGLLISLYVVTRHPEFGEIIAQISQY